MYAQHEGLHPLSTFACSITCSLFKAFYDDKANYSFRPSDNDHSVVCKSARSGKEYTIRFKGAHLTFYDAKLCNVQG